MRSEYEKLIAEHDKTLSLLRASKLDASPKLHSAWDERINAALDERLRLMALRDAQPVTAA